MPRYGMSNGCRCTRTFLGAPPTPRFGVSEAKWQTPGAKRAAGTRRSGLFDIVRWKLRRTVRQRAASSAVLILRSARAVEVPQNQDARARVSKDGDGALMLRDGEEPRGRHALSRLILRRARSARL